MLVGIALSVYEARTIQTKSSRIIVCRHANESYFKPKGKNSLFLADRAFRSAHPLVEDSLLERLGRWGAPAFAVERCSP
jgi:hypothetical protein